MVLPLTRANVRRHYEDVGKMSMLSIFGSIDEGEVLVPTAIPTEYLDQTWKTRSERTQRETCAAFTAHVKKSGTGAAKKKREQLKRKGVRLGVTPTYFLREYAEKKNLKKHFRKAWYGQGGNDTDMPEEYKKCSPARHEPTGMSLSP